MAEDEESLERRTYTEVKGEFRVADDEEAMDEYYEDELTEGTDSDEENVGALEARHQALNKVFGIKPWRTSVSHKDFENANRQKSRIGKPTGTKSRLLSNIGNIAWSVCFGWILALGYLIAAGVLFITFVGRPYARLAKDLAFYFLWPFGKFLVMKRTDVQLSASEFVKTEDNQMRLKESNSLIPDQTVGNDHSSLFGFILWIIFGAIPLAILHLIIFSICWMLVIMIPMAKVNWEASKLLFQRPVQKSLRVSKSYSGSNIALCTFEAVNVYYYKYSVGGMNIILVNLVPFVGLSLFLGYFPFPNALKPDPIFLFIISLMSIIPLSYYIGTAVSSLSAQSNFAVGAVLNASFGSIIELILYFTAIRKGGLEELVQSSVTGSLLSALLLMPGLAMLFGGIVNPEQRFSPTVAGVSSTLLFIAVVGAYTPTIFYAIYGHERITCAACIPMNNTGPLMCSQCLFTGPNLDNDDIYTSHARPLALAVAVILPLAYVTGLLFTLKTHSHIYEPEEGEEHGGHDAPEWSRKKGFAILVGATILFALVAEELVNAIEPTLKSVGIAQSFVGLTVVAIGSSAAELVNAVLFAVNGNIALSIEIGSSVSVQIAMLQMPALVVFSAIINDLSSENSFVLIFPLLQTFCVILAVIIINYTTTEGYANYFKGASLIFIWVLFMCAFFFVPDDSSEGSSSAADDMLYFF